jgi:hypothetical protein
MVNLTETMIGVAIVSLLVTVVCVVRGKRTLGRRWGWMTLASGVVAAALEIYIRVRM